MNIGILGTGMVGHAIGTKLIELGHAVKMGSRSASNAKAIEWVKQNGSRASHGTFADAASFGEIIFNCTDGAATLEALKLAGAENLKGKILIDITNPLDFSTGRLTLTICNTDSNGEQIQRAFPQTKVVKSLNTVNCKVMIDPAAINGDHAVFVGGNDAQAKATVTWILKDWFGWKSVIDLGDIATSRGVEMMLPLWVNLMSNLKIPMFNFAIVK